MTSLAATTLTAAAVGVQASLFVGGLAAALFASRRAITHTRALAAQVGAPPFIVGVTLVSLGTDLPEIANSIAAHLQGQGDVNVGDSVGSTLTQYTLVLGLFPLIVAAVPIDRRSVGLVSALTIGGLALTIAAVADGWLARWEGAILVVSWALFTWIVVRLSPNVFREERPEGPERRPLTRVAVVLLALGVVAFGATIAVRALVRIAELAGVPEFVIAFFGASIGTSAPEIVVDVTALLRGAPGIALGDALGSSLVDATLSIGVGPLVAPAEVTPGLAVTGSLYALAAVAVAGGVLAARRVHDRRTMVLLFALYALAYVVVLGAR